MVEKTRLKAIGNIAVSIILLITYYYYFGQYCEAQARVRQGKARDGP